VHAAHLVRRTALAEGIATAWRRDLSLSMIRFAAPYRWRPLSSNVKPHCRRADRSSLEGKLFTTHRILVSRLFGLLVLAYVLLASPPTFLGPLTADLVGLAGFFLLAVAALGRLWCLVFIAGKKNEILLAEGPYSITRNPLYLFTFLGVVGFGLAVENPWLAAVLGVSFASYYPFTVAHEEKRLISIFGTEYSRYCARTPRWIPDFRLYQEPLSLVVYPAKIRHGILDAMWFLWAFLLWEALEAFRQAGVLHTWL
jgi:protein-S-isoprenylcysteine O-methyltransferase Ste14